MIEAVQSPEVLDDYLRVTTPGIWIFLAAVVCLLAGVLLWGTFGSIETKLTVPVSLGWDRTCCAVPYDQYLPVVQAGEITIDGQVYELDTEYCGVQMTIDETVDPQVVEIGHFQMGDYVAVIALKDTLPGSGVLVGSVTTRIIKPISLLLQ